MAGTENTEDFTENEHTFAQQFSASGQGRKMLLSLGFLQAVVLKHLC